MIITKRSALTGIVHSKELPITPEQYKAWERGGLVSVVMPHLSASDREFLVTGTLDEEWDAHVSSRYESGVAK
jgi:hypothetical protein